MSLAYLMDNYLILFFIFARIVPLFYIIPLFSIQAVPYLVKVSLSMMIAILVLPSVVSQGYVIPESVLYFFLYMIGEIMIGIIIGYVILGYFTIFQLAGQFFTIQMGFSAASVFDPIGQMQIPIMGQLFNLAASYVFICTGGFRKLFLIGIYETFNSITPTKLVYYTSDLNEFFSGFLGVIFKQAFVIALPIIGTLLLCSLTLGLLAKAAPQMNLLMLGFPINISVAFLMIIVSMPYLIDFFGYVFDEAFIQLRNILTMGDIHNVKV